MIKIQLNNNREATITWETGEDYVYLTQLRSLIELRNKDKKEIIKQKIGEE